MDTKPTGRKPFELPMMSVIRYSRDNEGFVAHALDFDLVAVGNTEEEATEKIRWAIKAYIEYGLKNYWQDHIIFRAPEETANELSPGSTTLKIMEPLMILDRKMGLARATPTHEQRTVDSLA
jgi:predicted RNase H-like HicB family nuclease